VHIDVAVCQKEALNIGLTGEATAGRHQMAIHEALPVTLFSRTTSILTFCVATLTVGAGAGHAGSKCTDRGNQCTRVIGCILGAPNELFFGEVHGIENGRIAAQTNLGVTCRGTFKRTVFGAAKANVSCDDGRTGRARFAYYHKHTGTGRGKGKMSDGEEVVFWAGDKLPSYFLNLQESRFDALILCAKAALEHSGDLNVK
jgi:hypothetical protein